MKPTATIYLHCDPTANHYLKVLMDAVFHPNRFLNEITWKRTHSHGNVGRNFGSVCDTILVYTKTAEYTWNQQYVPFSKEYIEKTFKYTEPHGRHWQSVTLRNPSKRLNLHYPYKASNGVTYEPHPNGWSCDRERIKRYDREGRLHFPKKSGGALRLKMYLDESHGIRLQNLWDDVLVLGANASERESFPTQKPEALLERIISTSSNEGDVVLDPFCGCGTAITAAQRLRRRWIGIDITHVATGVIKNRLRRSGLIKGKDFGVTGDPKDVASAIQLAEDDPYEFQWWATSLVGGAAADQRKKGADRGIDGWVVFHDDESGRAKHGIIQVKSGRVSSAHIRDLVGVVHREKAEIGVFITIKEPTSEMRKEAASVGFYELPGMKAVPRIQIRTIEELLAGVTIALPSHVNVTFRQPLKITKEVQLPLLEGAPARRKQRRPERARR